MLKKIASAPRLQGSAAFLFAGPGPRVMLAPDDGGGSGGGDGGSAGGDGGGGGSAPPVPGDNSSPGEGGGEPSLLGQALAPKGGAGADANPPPGSKDDGTKQTGDKDVGDKAKPAEGEAKTEPPADEAPKDIDGNELPDAYEFKMPDGFTADQALLDLATPVLKEHRLSPSQAQAVVDLYAQVTKDSVTKHMDTVNGWKTAAKADKAFNEDGGWDKNLGLAHKGFQAFGNEEALQILDTYGLGDHPAFLRMFRDIGKAVGETGTIGGDAATGQRSTADIMFPSMRKSN